MAIKDEAAFEELKPYLKMTVAPNGVTVGDLNFVVAQTQWSTALLPITTANTVPADVSLNLFQTAQGDPGQGFSTGLTISQTSWQDTQGRLPANQVFIATSCGFQLFNRFALVEGAFNAAAGQVAAGTATAPIIETLLPKVSATHAIARKLSWEVTIGDGISRNYGSLLDYSGYGGVYSVVNPVAANLAAAGVQMGHPDTHGRKMRIPLVFPPNISVQIRVRGGEGFTVDPTQGAVATAGPLPANTFLAVKQYLHGYLCTMPVG
jgi:hypothetical protein